MAALMVRAAACFAAFVAGVLVTFGATRDQERGPSADRTIYSFVHAVRHHNYGRACSWFAEDIRGTHETDCGLSVAAQIGGAMQFGLDPYGQAYVVPGSRREVNDTTVTYVIASRDNVLPAYLFTVSELESGRWAITDTRAV